MLFSLGRYSSSTLTLLLRVHSQEDSHVSLHNCQWHMTQSHFWIGQCLSYTNVYPSSPVAPAHYFDIYGSVQNQGTCWIAYVSSKGYRKLGCGRKVVPFFFPGLLLLNPFSPATIAHSTKPLPILDLFRSKWEGGTDLCSCAIPNSTEEMGGPLQEPVLCLYHTPIWEQCLSSWQVPQLSILLLKSCSSGLLLHSAHDFRSRKREEKSLLESFIPTGCIFALTNSPLTESVSMEVWFNMVGLVLLLPLHNMGVGLSHIRVALQEYGQPFCLGPSCSYSREMWEVPLNLCSTPEFQWLYWRYGSRRKSF